MNKTIPQKIMHRLGKEWFLGGMVSMVVLASYFPDVGRVGGTLHGDQLADIGIAVVFFLHGLGLSITALRNGLSRWKVHVFVQLSTFALFPVLGILGMKLFGRWIPHDLGLGFYYLCALPSTISTSVAMTAMARGNVPAAIFNATLSSLLGIILTPLWVSAFTGTSGQSLDFGATVLGVAKLLLLPLMIGKLLRPLLHEWHHRNKKYTNLLDRLVILLLVFTAFCDSVHSGLWDDSGIELLSKAFVGAFAILVIVLAITIFGARRMRMNVEDEITSVFCGSKKTMASGVPMAKLLFGSHPALGAILLPVMLYHQLQIFICSWLASRYAGRGADRTE